MYQIKYVIGDATSPPETGGIRILPHICNNLGGWGSGYVVALSKRWMDPERRYREWARRCSETGMRSMPMGKTQLVRVEVDSNWNPMFVANMVAQEGHKGPSNPVAVRYDALEDCLHYLARWIIALEETRTGLRIGTAHVPLPPTTIHMPRIGCGLGGGDWARVESLILKTLSPNWQVTIYDLTEEDRMAQIRDLAKVIEENS